MPDKPKTIEETFGASPLKRTAIEQDAHLAICHLIGGANGLPFDKELTDDQIKAQVAKCIRVWNEIRRQLLTNG